MGSSRQHTTSVRRYQGERPADVRREVTIGAGANGVPDNPIGLPEGCRACAACGVAVAGDHEQIRADILGRESDPVRAQVPPLATMTFTRCRTCEAVHEMADRIVGDHPALVAKIGSPAIAIDRIEAALLGLAVLNLPLPDPGAILDIDALALLRHLAVPGVTAQWRSRFSPVLVAGASTETCAVTAWGHVMPGQRLALRTGYGAMLKERVARSAPPVRLPLPPPPDGGPEVVPIPDGCLICGRSHVLMSAVEVARAGGRRRAAEQVWTPQLVSPTALGGRRSPRLHSGHLCVDCAEATESVGSIGPTAMERALIASLHIVGRDDEAQQMRNGEGQLRVVGWAVTTLPPNEIPFSHLDLG